MKIGRRGGLGSNPLTREAMALQKKGTTNLSVTELREGIQTCERMEEWVRDAKGRRSWKEARMEAEERLLVLQGQDRMK